MSSYEIIKKLGELLKRNRAQYINALIIFNQTYLIVVKNLKDINIQNLVRVLKYKKIKIAKKILASWSTGIIQA